MSPEELEQLLTTHFADHVSGSVVAYGNVTVTLDAEGYVAAAKYCRDDPRVGCDFFDCLIGVDERDEGFAVVANLYSTQTKARVLLRHVCTGGREKPVAPTLTPLWRGANWHEREAWDMFGIDFDGHPGLAPRLLTAENFEGWPLRKDFPLATREAKPWPGAKEPGEGGHDAGETQREAQITSTTTSEPIAGQQEEGAREDTQAKAERARQKAAEMRRQKAAEREAAGVAAPVGADQADGPTEAPAATAETEAPAPTEPTPTSATPADAQPDAAVEAATEEAAAQAIPEAAPDSLPHEEDAPARPGEHDADDAEATGESAGGPISAPPHGDAGTTPTAEDPADPSGLGREVEPPTTQAPGEAPVEGGLRETIDEQASASDHGQTPPQPPADESEGPADGAKVVDLMADSSEAQTPARDADGDVRGVEAVPPPETPDGPGPSPAPTQDLPAEQRDTPTDQPGHTSAEQPTDEGPGYAGSNEGDADRAAESGTDRESEA